MTPLSLQHPYPTPPAPATRIEVGPGVYWLRMPLPFALNHINLWLLRDAAGWVIVDCGYGLETVQAYWETLLAELDGPVTRIIVTHFHPDHVGLAAWLQQRTQAPVAMTAGEYLTAHAVFHETSGHGTAAMLEQFRKHGLASARIAALEERSNGYVRGVPSLPHTYERLFHQDRLMIDGRCWQVIVGYGHAPEHAALYCADAGMLISGDMLLPKISTNISVFAVTPGADALAQYLDSIDAYRELPEETLVLPSHGLPFVGIHARVAAQHAHHEERLRVLEEACTAPRCAAELLDVLFERELDTHQTMFAMGEAIAHLNRLEKASRLTRSTGDDGVIRFVRKT